MPFTLSHPAAVLPLAGGPLAPSALVAGAVAPDAPYYLWPAYAGQPTHETWAVLALDVPLGLGLLALFHLVLKRPVVVLAPDAVRPALVRAALRFRRPRSRRDAVLLAAAVALGAATHVGWDAFTHTDGQVAGRVEGLRRAWLGDVPGYRVLQHLSTVGGAAVLVWWARRWCGEATRAAVPPTLDVPGGRRWVLRGLVAGLAVATGAARGAVGAGSGSATETVEGLVLGAVLGLALASALLSRR